MKREMYEEPEMEIVTFNMADVITTSQLCEMSFWLYSATGCSDILNSTQERTCQPAQTFTLPDGGCAVQLLYAASSDGCDDGAYMVANR